MRVAYTIFHCPTGFNFSVKNLKFFGANAEAFITKSQKDFAVKSIPFVLE